MTNQEIAKLYANGKTNGQAGNMYIVGDCIYSYGQHFTIARKLREGLYIINANRYSNTTARHISHVRGELEKMGAIIIESVQDDRNRLELNLKYLEDKRDEITQKIKRARTAHMRDAYNTQLWYCNNMLSYAQKILRVK